jgi:hypothetical protein
VKTATDPKEFHAALAAVDITKIPVMSTDRHIPRKLQAKLARMLLRSMGIKGVSITTPNYSMAQSVQVRMPRRDDYDLDEHGFAVPGNPAAVANNEARQRMLAILLAAFPRHDDRSDTMTDYFDYCWSVN